MTIAMQDADIAATLQELEDGDRIEVCFDPPLVEEGIGEIVHAKGSLRRMVGKCFLIADSHRKSWSMPPCVDLDVERIAHLALIKSSKDIQVERHTKARGIIVFPAPPEDERELEEQLSDLARMVVGCDDTTRRRELEHQFEDVADIVALAKRKRNYLLCRARLGQDFHPWTWPDDRVYRNETVRPLPSDFLLDETRRKDQPRRLEEAVRIFGEAEREVRQIASLLKRLGFEARRPHPNAQELLVRFKMGSGAADLTVKSSPNGLWESAAGLAQNKTQARTLRRVLRSGALDRLREALVSVGWSADQLS